MRALNISERRVSNSCPRDKPGEDVFDALFAGQVDTQCVDHLEAAIADVAVAFQAVGEYGFHVRSLAKHKIDTQGIGHPANVPFASSEM
jgi:hypothetical protein